jgi:hypothetical protein
VVDRDYCMYIFSKFEICLVGVQLSSTPLDTRHLPPVRSGVTRPLLLCACGFFGEGSMLTLSYHTIPSTCPDVPTEFQINQTLNGGEISSFLKQRFSRFWRLFVCLFTKCKQMRESGNQSMHANLGYQPEVSTKFQINRTAHG